MVLDQMSHKRYLRHREMSESVDRVLICETEHIYRSLRVFTVSGKILNGTFIDPSKDETDVVFFHRRGVFE